MSVSSHVKRALHCAYRDVKAKYTIVKNKSFFILIQFSLLTSKNKALHPNFPQVISETIFSVSETYDLATETNGQSIL